MAVHQLKSRFYDSVDDKPWQEYPRPQLVRDSYLNLNGYWKYAIRKKTEPLGEYDGDILVPFSPESLLSGVMKTVTPDDTLYYKLVFDVPTGFIKEKTLLHFTAVDYECSVSLNGKKIGEHRGGFYAFTLDITDAIRSGENTLTLEVCDPSDTGVGAFGKQKLHAGNIWYTPQSGIWGTVWMESVVDEYISDLKITPDIDTDSVTVSVRTTSKNIDVSVIDNGRVIASGKGKDCVKIKLSEYEFWSPENPKLYDLKIVAGKDVVSSYFGMRKFGTGKDKNGIQRLMLNNKPYFHKGVLDQGYWSDGKLTPPSDEACIYDIQMLKDMGFNMIRKHIKIEPLRWYYHCDRIGMLVWQDMVNGGSNYNMLCIGILPFIGLEFKDTRHRRFFARESEEGRREYETDMRRTVSYLINCVSLAMWVPFNEGWGQFDSKRISGEIKKLDPTRTIDSTSGWHDQGGGDFVSKHIYFTPVYVPRDKRCYLLSEFGGYSKPTVGHMYNPFMMFGYHMYPTKRMLSNSFKKLFEKRIIANVSRGLSATVYTQVSDVEEEINGLVTYDRMVEKFDRDFVKEINDRIFIED